MEPNPKLYTAFKFMHVFDYVKSTVPHNDKAHSYRTYNSALFLELVHLMEKIINKPSAVRF